MTTLLPFIGLALAILGAHASIVLHHRLADRNAIREHHRWLERQAEQEAAAVRGARRMHELIEQQGETAMRTVEQLRRSQDDEPWKD